MKHCRPHVHMRRYRSGKRVIVNHGIAKRMKHRSTTWASLDPKERRRLLDEMNDNEVYKPKEKGSNISRSII